MSDFTGWVLTYFATLLHLPKEQVDLSQIAYLEHFQFPDDLADYLSGFVEGERGYSEAKEFAIAYFARKNASLKAEGPLDVSTNASKTVDVDGHHKEATPSSSVGHSMRSEGASEKDIDVETNVGEVVHAKRNPVHFGKNVKKIVNERRICLCNGTDHKFMWNCIECGKIMCEAEGSGPCLFCAASAPQDQRDKRRWIDYHNKPGYAKAHALVDRLVEYDLESAKRTIVLDMETDFYAEKQNPWADEDARQWASFRDIQSRQKRIEGVTFDFLNQKISVTNAQEQFEQEQEEALRLFLARDTEAPAVRTNLSHRRNDIPKDYKLWSNQHQQHIMEKAVDADDPPSAHKWEKVFMRDRQLEGDIRNTHTQLTMAEFPTTDLRVSSIWQQSSARKELGPVPEQSKVFGRWKSSDFELDVDADGTELLTLQAAEQYDQKSPHTEFCSSDFGDDNQDHGVCLTLHQPGASLLAHGFKRLEGRVWQTDYRGRLWIHADAFKPDEICIQDMKSYYSKIYGNHPPLPSAWPTSALLGSVDLIDCVSGADFKANLLKGKYKRGGSPFVSVRENNDSPYIFVCKAPRLLVVPIQMTGRERLWSIPAYRLPSLQQVLRPVLWSHLDPILESSGSALLAKHSPSSMSLVLKKMLTRQPLSLSRLQPHLKSENITSVIPGVLHISQLLDSMERDHIIHILLEAMQENSLDFNETLKVHTTEFGLRYEETSREWVTYGRYGNEREIDHVPPEFEAFFECVLRQLSVIKSIDFSRRETSTFPPLQALQFLYLESSRLVGTMEDPIVAWGDFSLLVVLTGQCKVVIEDDSMQWELTSKETKETLKLVNRTNTKSKELCCGDGLFALGRTKITKLMRSGSSQGGNQEEADSDVVKTKDALSGYLLALFRANCRKV